jgi:hypothetical protein
MKEYTVEYGGDKYTREALRYEDLKFFGLKIAPKLFGFGSTIAVVTVNKFEQGENLFSFYQTIKDVFNPDDWDWLTKTFLWNEDYPLKINDKFASKDDISDHFAGDFLRMYVVVWRFSILNMGKLSTLTASLDGLAKSIATSLNDLAQKSLKTVEVGLKKNAKDTLQKK